VIVASKMKRTLSDVTYSEGNIASGKCSRCGQFFTTSPVVNNVGENTEWEVVGAFGGHECRVSSLKSVT
jgi:hypothetical protein